MKSLDLGEIIETGERPGRAMGLAQEEEGLSREKMRLLFKDKPLIQA